MLKFRPTVPVDYYSKESTYIPGKGNTTTWKRVLSTSLFCEWRSSYGERALAAQAVGVKDSATVRTFYHPDLHQKLQQQQVLLVKYGGELPLTKSNEPDVASPHIYELWGGVDNKAEENQYMEFNVRRYEAK